MVDSGFQDVLGQAKRMLMESPFPSLRRLELSQSGEHVRLSGAVDSFYLKQLAQETVRSATRGIDVLNEVSVCARLVETIATADIVATDSQSVAGDDWKEGPIKPR